MEYSLAVSQIVKHRINIWATCSTSMCIAKETENTCAHKILYTNVHSSISHNIPKEEPKCLSVDECISNICYIHIYIHIYNGPSFSCKKVWRMDPCYQTAELWKQWKNWRKPNEKATWCLVCCWPSHDKWQKRQHQSLYYLPLIYLPFPSHPHRTGMSGQRVGDSVITVSNSCCKRFSCSSTFVDERRLRPRWLWPDQLTTLGFIMFHW